MFGADVMASGPGELSEEGLAFWPLLRTLSGECDGGNYYVHVRLTSVHTYVL